MIECMHCTYPRNPDTATNCVKCRALLTRRSSTLNEDEFQRGRTAVEDYPVSSGMGAGIGDGRRRTVAEGVAQSGGYPPPTAESKIPEAPWAGGNAYGAGSSGVAASAGSGGGSGGGMPRTASAGEPSRRKTMYIGTPATDEPPAAPARSAPTPGLGGVRKIVGILITYSWEEQGQVFPVLEGRNLIGKDPAQCNICIPQDQTLSDVNSSIAYRSQFVIRDKDSMSGTFVDGGFVEAEPVPLRNYAKIRTGSTNWTFVAIQPQTATTASPASATTDPGVEA